MKAITRADRQPGLSLAAKLFTLCTGRSGNWVIALKPSRLAEAIQFGSGTLNVPLPPRLAVRIPTIADSNPIERGQ
jgi:hypothetical protein